MRFPNLRQLEVQIWPTVRYTTTPSSPQLNRIVMHAQTVNDHLHILPVLYGDTLKHLELMHNEKDWEPACTHLVSLAIVDNRSLQGLTSIRITLDDEDLPERLNDEVYVLSWACFKPLLQLPNITTFEVLPCYVVIRNNDLSELAQSWTQIECLTLIPEDDIVDGQCWESFVTPLGLLPLMQHCPKLKILHLFINASTKARRADEVLQNVVIANHAFNQLHFGASLIPQGEVVHLAAYLAAIVPGHLDITSTQGSYNFEETADDIQQRLQQAIRLRDLLQCLKTSDLKLDCKISLADNIGINNGILSTRIS